MYDPSVGTVSLVAIFWPMGSTNETWAVSDGGVYKDADKRGGILRHSYDYDISYQSARPQAITQGKVGLGYTYL